MRSGGRLAAPMVWAAVWAAAWTVGGGRASAQQGCQFADGSGTLRRVDNGGSAITYVSTPNLVCRDGVRIRADSATSFEAANFVQLVGRVRFDDPERSLTARTAEYYTTVGRLQAHGAAQLFQKSDSSMIRGDELTYERESPSRPRALLDVVGGRPTARLYLQSGDSTAPAAPRDTTDRPYDIAADRIFVDGDNYFRARGTVEITRDSLRAYADSVEYDEVAGTMRLMERARMTIQERQLSGGTITASFEGNDVSQVEARDQALLTGSDLRLSAPIVRVYFDDGTMGRVVAVDVAPLPERPTADRPRPTATSKSFVMVADSLDLLAPNEALDRIHASGHARAESTARDSLNAVETPALARSDWMEGDTIDAAFEPADSSSADSAAGEIRLKSLAAAGKARSLYRMAANDSARARGEKRPAIHYVTARAITLQMSDGEVRHMDVTGQTEGIHAEPTPPAATAPGAAPAGPQAKPGEPPSTSVTPPAPAPPPPDR